MNRKGAEVKKIQKMIMVTYASAVSLILMATGGWIIANEEPVGFVVLSMGLVLTVLVPFLIFKEERIDEK